MNIKEIRKLKKEELFTELGSLESELTSVRVGIRAGKEKNVRKSLRIKKNIARIRTVLNELERNNEKTN